MIYPSKYLPLSLLCLAITTLSSCSMFQSSDKPVASEAPTSSEANKSAARAPQIGGVKEIEAAQEFRDIISNGKPTIAKFYASWCGPCQRMKPIFAATADKHSEQANFVSLNHENKALEALFTEYQVNGFPTFIYLDGQGKVINARPGGMDANAFDAIVADFIKKQS